MAKTSSRLKKLRGKHSLKGWYLDAVAHLSERNAKAALKAASDAIEVSFSQGYSDVGMPYLTGDKEVDYPLTISLTIGVGENDSEYPVYIFDLRDIILEEMAFAKTGGVCVTDAVRVRKVAQHLRALAADVDDLASLIEQYGDKEDEIDLAFRLAGDY